jgi:hypothetical protein
VSLQAGETIHKKQTAFSSPHQSIQDIAFGFWPTNDKHLSKRTQAQNRLLNGTHLVVMINIKAS